MVLNPSLSIEKTEVNDFLVRNLDTNEVFRVGLQEGIFLLNYGLEENKKEELSWSREKLIKAEEIFFNAGLLVGEDASVYKRKKKFNITKIKLFECSIDGFLDKNNKLIMVLTGKKFRAVYVMIILTALVIMFERQEDISNVLKGYLLAVEGSKREFFIRDIVYVYILIIITMFFHEMAHMFMCRRAGGRVGKTGILLYFLQPALFCDLTSLYTIKSKKQKIDAFFAGVYSQWVTSSFSIIVYFMFSDFLQIKLNFIILFWFMNILLSFYNLIPFVKLDGYWILSVFWEVKNLYDKSMLVILNKFRIVPTKIKEKSKETALFVYGIAAILFYISFWGVSLYGIYKIIFRISEQLWAIMATGIIMVMIIRHIVIKFCNYINEQKKC